MKRALLLFLVLVVAGCSGKDDGPTGSTGGGGTTTACYTFTIRIVTTISPSIPGYPQTTTSTVDECGLTPAGAEQRKAELTTTIVTTSGGYTVTATQTCSYIKR